MNKPEKEKLNPNWYGTYYLNDDKTYKPCSTTEWGAQLELMRETESKHVARDYIDDKFISTVWLGLDYSFDEKSDPLLFETMVFPNNEYIEIYCSRYSTWDEALEGHQKAIQWVKDGCKDE